MQELKLNSYYVKKCKNIGPIIREIRDDNTVTMVLYGHKKKNKLCYGVVVLADEDIFIVKKLNKDKEYGERFTFKVSSNKTKHSYLCGIFHTKNEYTSSDHLNFRDCYYGTIYTFRNQYNFVFGSCRFFPNIFGRGILVDRTDKPFKSILKIVNKYQISALFFIGDSVYMDIVKWLPFRLKDEKDINRIHITARTTPGFRKLGSKIEIKEIPDDHEYRDNGDPSYYFKDKKAYTNCINAINTFQISSGPHLKNENIKYWSYFKRQNIPFFMLDSRYERWEDENNNKRIMSEEQFESLKQSLLENKNNNLPFIIFCPIPFILQNGGDDLFSSSKKDQKNIIKFIVKNQIKNVFFLTGDAHASVSSKFKIYKNGVYTGISIVEILCSGIYQYAHDSAKSFKNELVIDNYSIHSIMNLNTLQSKVIRDDNFCLVEVDKENKKLKCSYFKSSGKFIRKNKYNF